MPIPPVERKKPVGVDPLPEIESMPVADDDFVPTPASREGL